MRRLRLLFLLLVAIAVPFQAALAVTASQCMALHQDAADHAGHGDDGHSHDKQQGSPCGPCAACCASAVITSVITLVHSSPGHGLVTAAPDLPPLVPLLSGIDRPPRSL